MIVYNVTTKIDIAVANNWLAWMREEQIPLVLSTGLFSGYRLLRIDEVEEHPDGLTYALQYTCLSRENFDTYVRHHSAAHDKLHRERYNNRFIIIRTIMQVVEERVLFASQS